MPNVDVIDGMSFGTGIDLSGRIFGDGVKRTPAEVVGGGQTSDIILTLVESQDEQNRALNLSTEVSAAFGLFGGSAKFSLSEDMHFHQFSINLVIRALVENAFSQMRDVQLTDRARQFLVAGNVAGFREQFGDFFIRGMRTGGQLCAILQIIAKDQSDHDEIKATLRAGGILGGVAAETNNSFSKLVQKATANRETRLHHRQIGGTQVISIKPEEMVAHALRFAQEVKQGSSEAFTALAVPYSTVDRPDGPNFIDIQAAREALDRMMRVRSDAMTRRVGFDFVVAHPEQFNIPSGMHINSIVGRFGTAIAALQSAASKCVNNPLAASDAERSIAGLDIPLDELPPRRGGTATSPLDGVWVPENDPEFDVSRLQIVTTAPGHLSVIVTFKHGQHAPIVKSTSATLDGGTNTFRTPIIQKQIFHTGLHHFIRVDTHKVAIGAATTGNRTLVTQSVVRTGQPDINLPTMFRRM